MKIKEYIESGILESYVLGSATDTEVEELMRLKEQYPEINNTLGQLEADMERIAQYMAIKPPPDMLGRIENSINDIVVQTEADIIPLHREWKQNPGERESRSRYIEVEAESNYMRIHKNWKWVLAAVFVLGKIFLACAIYFYLESRQAKQQVEESKAELRELRSR